MRSDARRNHEQLLTAARDVVVEIGPGAPLDEIARRAGVGIATLYRRFADRGTLLTAVVVDALERSRASAQQVLEGADGLDALAAYMHDVLDLRVSAVIPMVLGRDDLDEAAIAPAREASASAVERLVQAAHDDGSLPREISFGDIGTLLVRLSRPLPGGIPPPADAELAHRHLDLVLAGLRSGTPGVSEKGWSRQELGRLRGTTARADQPNTK